MSPAATETALTQWDNNWRSLVAAWQREQQRAERLQKALSIALGALDTFADPKNWDETELSDGYSYEWGVGMCPTFVANSAIVRAQAEAA